MKKLDKPHRFAVIGICWLMVAILSAVSYYLEQSIWIIIFQIGIIILAIYGFYLFMLVMHDYIEMKAWQEFQKEYDEIVKKEKE